MNCRVFGLCSNSIENFDITLVHMKKFFKKDLWTELLLSLALKARREKETERKRERKEKVRKKLTGGPDSPASPFFPFFPRLPGGPGGPVK